MKELSLVIPARNSEKFIENSLKGYHSAFSKKFEKFEMIPVFNDSCDNGAEICKQLSEKLPIKVIEIPQRGKGYALVKGFNNSQFDIMGFLDADSPFNLDNILKMVDRLEEHDVVMASKYLKKQARLQDSQMRRLISLGGGVVSRVLFNLKFPDTQAGAKFFKRQVWNTINTNFTCNGFDFDIEFLYKAQKAKFNIQDFYMPFRRDEFSTFRLKYLPGMLKRVFKLRFLTSQR